MACDKNRCQQGCKEWVFTKTLGSPDTPVWHCRQGFEPSKDCQQMAEYNNDIRRKYYREHPEALQFKIHFK